MAIQLEEVAQAGGSAHHAVTSTPQARRLLEGPVKPALPHRSDTAPARATAESPAWATLGAIRKP